MKLQRLILIAAVPLLLGAGCDPVAYVSKFLPKPKTTTVTAQVSCDYGGKTFDKGTASRNGPCPSLLNSTPVTSGRKRPAPTG